MKSTVYQGRRTPEVKEQPVPALCPGESFLEFVRVGVCDADLMIFQGSDAAPSPGDCLGYQSRRVALARKRQLESYRLSDAYRAASVRGPAS